ncbi:hypothetical protein ACO0QE_001818 [Hanseniaspora vineae]
MSSTRKEGFKTFKVLKQFDAFPKVAEQHQKAATKGNSIKSYLWYAFLLFMLWTEFGSYFGGYIDEYYVVDKKPRTTAQLNLDLFVHSKCQNLDVNFRDKTGDRLLVNELLHFEKMPFFIPHTVKKFDSAIDITTPDMDEIFGKAMPAEFRDAVNTDDLPGSENFDGCHIFGNLPINKVYGALQITAKGHGYRSVSKVSLDEMDFSHVINELSFGEFFPYIDNPLDNIAKLLAPEKRLSKFQYYIDVVPTIYKKLGAILETSQFAVSETVSPVQIGSNGRPVAEIPGIFFIINFDALSVVVEDVRLNFFQFLAKLVTILCLVFYLFTWFHKLLDKLLVSLGGRKWSLYYTAAEPKGLLDSEKS